MLRSKIGHALGKNNTVFKKNGNNGVGVGSSNTTAGNNNTVKETTD